MANGKKRLTRVPSLALGFVSERNPRPRVNDRGQLHDETVAVELVNVAAGVGQRNFVNFVGIQPNFALPASQNVGGQSLLQF